MAFRKGAQIVIYIIMAILFKGFLFGYTLDDFEWVDKADMIYARSSQAAAVVNNKIYVIGGERLGTIFYDSIEEYNPISNTWELKTSMSMPRRNLGAGVVNNKIYLIGGGTEDQSQHALVEEFDPSANTCIVKSSMTVARFGLVTAVVNDKIYAIGGYNYNLSGLLNTVEEYDPADDTWTTKTPMPTARHAMGAAVVNNKIYVMGGYTRGPEDKDPKGLLNTLEVYDPADDKWETKEPMPTARLLLSSIVFNGKIYAIAGFALSNLKTVEEYDISKNSWVKKEDIQTARNSCAAVTVLDKVYVMGGNQWFMNYFSSVEEGTLKEFVISSKLYDAHCYPCPVRFSKGDVLKFTNLTPNSVVTVISPAGHIVQKFHADEYGSIYPWDGKTDTQEQLGSGTYIVHAKDLEGNVKKFNILVIQ
ncbi:Kelch repeat-containing protein [bacterium]